MDADFDRVAVAHITGTLDDLDLVLLHQALDAFPELVDDSLAPGRYALVVGLYSIDLQSELLGPVLDAVVELGRLQHRLRGDAADVEAGAPELAGLDHGGLEPELAEPDGGRVAAEAAAEHDNVEVVSHYPS